MRVWNTRMNGARWTKKQKWNKRTGLMSENALKHFSLSSSQFLCSYTHILVHFDSCNPKKKKWVHEKERKKKKRRKEKSNSVKSFTVPINCNEKSMLACMCKHERMSKYMFICANANQRKCFNSLNGWLLCFVVRRSHAWPNKPFTRNNCSWISSIWPEFKDMY